MFSIHAHRLIYWTSGLQLIHLCKEESCLEQQNHLCRKSQRAGWALNPRRRAAGRSPWAPTGCWCQSTAWFRRGHKTPWCSCCCAGYRCRGNLGCSRWLYKKVEEGKDNKGLVNDRTVNFFNFLKLLWPSADTPLTPRYFVWDELKGK